MTDDEGFDFDLRPSLHAANELVLMNTLSLCSMIFAGRYEDALPILHDLEKFIHDAIAWKKESTPRGGGR